MTAALNPERPRQQTVVERSGKRDDQRVPCQRGGRRDPPAGRRNRLDLRRSDAKLTPVRRLERLALRIPPVSGNLQRVGVPGAKWSTQLLVRQNALLHAARIEEERVPRVIGVPEIGLHRKEGNG